MRFTRLTYRNGTAVYVNAAQVIALESHPVYVDGDRVGDHTRILFALSGHVVSDEGLVEHEPYHITVREGPDEVAGRMLTPLGVPA